MKKVIGATIGCILGFAASQAVAAIDTSRYTTSAVVVQETGFLVFDALSDLLLAEVFGVVTIDTFIATDPGGATMDLTGLQKIFVGTKDFSISGGLAEFLFDDVEADYLVTVIAPTNFDDAFGFYAGSAEISVEKLVAAVPNPATASLLLAGLGALALFRRRAFFA